MKSFAIQAFRSLTAVLTLSALMLTPIAARSQAGARQDASDSTRSAAGKTYKHLPISFEPNLGQTANEVKFISRNADHILFLTTREAVLEMAAAGDGNDDKIHLSSQAPQLAEPDVLRMKFDGANTSTEIMGVDQLPGTINYLVGKDSSQGRTDVPTFKKVKYASIYHGVDLIYYGNPNGELEYDFVLAPGADPSVINLSFEGAEKVEVDDTGDLVLQTRTSSIRQHRPAVYQQVGDERTQVTTQYKLTGNNRVSFQVGEYDAQKPLVIDPVLSFATYLGGSLGEASGKIAVDSVGNIYLTGSTFSTNFPHEGSLQPHLYEYNSFVTKLNRDGNSIVFSTFFGGGSSSSSSDRTVIRDIAVDSSGNIYLTGSTSSLDFPTTVGAFQVTHAPNSTSVSYSDDAFITKINSRGNGFIYSTFVGGSDSEIANGIAVDFDGNAYIAGSSRSVDFPSTAGAFQTVNHYDAFILKLNSDGSTLIYSTFLGGTDGDGALYIALDDSLNVYVAGVIGSQDFPVTYAVTPKDRYFSDLFVAKLNQNASRLIYSVRLGSSEEDTLKGLSIDAAGNAFITGVTSSRLDPRIGGQRPYPTKNAIQPNGGSDWDGFVTKINAAGNDLIYSTFMGGDHMDYCEDIAVDPMGNAYIVGYTLSRDFATKRALQNTCACSGDDGDGFVVKLNPDGQRYGFATYIGGSSDDSATAVAVDRFGSAYVFGWTRSTQFPTQDPLQPSNHGSYDLFILKFGNPTITSASVIGKKLFLSGENFDGAVVLLEGEEQNTRQDDEHPSERLIAKKAGKRIGIGQTVTLRVQNGDGALSTEFKFTRTE